MSQERFSSGKQERVILLGRAMGHKPRGPATPAAIDIADHFHGKCKESVLAGLLMADSVMIAENLHYGSMLMWSDIVFSQFAFDLIAMMQGTYRSGFLSSFYGMGRAEDF